MHGGKGSAPRPISVSQKEYETRWDAIFGRDLDKKVDSKLEEVDAEFDAIHKYNEETKEVKFRQLNK
jgi:hypothetical protein